MGFFFAFKSSYYLKKKKNRESEFTTCRILNRAMERMTVVVGRSVGLAEGYLQWTGLLYRREVLLSMGIRVV